MNDLLLQIILFVLGTIVLFMAGKQDNETRRPFLLIPAMILRGASCNIETGILVLVTGLFCFVLPAEVNKLIGKADLFLFLSIFVIYIFGNNLLMDVFILFTLLQTTIRLVLDIKSQKNKFVKHYVPLIEVYSKSFIEVLAGIVGLGLLALIVGFFLTFKAGVP